MRKALHFGLLLLVLTVLMLTSGVFRAFAYTQISLPRNIYQNQSSVVYDSHNNEVYVGTFPDPSTGTAVSAICDSNNTVIANIPGNATVIAFDSHTDELYAVAPGVSYLSVFSDVTNSLIKTIDIGGKWTAGVAFDSHNNEVYVTDSDANTVTVIDDTSKSVIKTIQIPDPTQIPEPWGITFDPHNDEIYVSLRPTYSSNAAVVISDSTNSVIATIPGPVGPMDGWGIVFDPHNNQLYMANQAGSVEVISDSTNTIIKTIPDNGAPLGVTFDSDMNQIYVTNEGLGSQNPSVSVIQDSTNTIINTLTGFTGPTGIAYDSNNNGIYVSNANNNINLIGGANAKKTCGILNAIPVNTQTIELPSTTFINTVSVPTACCGPISYENWAIAAIVAIVVAAIVGWYAAMTVHARSSRRPSRQRSR